MPSLFLHSLPLYSLTSPLSSYASTFFSLFFPARSLPPSLVSLPSLPLLLSPSALLWVGGSCSTWLVWVYIGGETTLTGSESGGAHLPHVPNRTTWDFFFPVSSTEDLLSCDSMTETKRKDRKGKKKGGKKGDSTAGKNKWKVVSV